MTVDFSLFGAREIAMFDFWSVAHLLWGIVMYPFLRKVFPNVSIKALLILIVVIAYSWEGTESSMERGLWGDAISVWKHGAEHWSNRFISDPLLALLGGFISTKKQKLWIWVIVPLAGWVLANYMAPNSMFIQELILGLFH